MEKQSNILRFALPVIAILAVITVYNYGYEKVRTERDTIKEAQIAKTRTLQKYISIIAEKPALESRLAALKEKRKADESKIIDAQTLSLAANTLENSVKSMITGKGGSISSARVEKPEDLEKFKVVNVTMDVTLPDTRALGDVIYNIETSTPYMVIRELDTRVRNFKEPRELMVKFRIAALTDRR
ncbi:MAG: type II secretion system protein M [Syntrophobacterales bacterium]|jgi:hypothetical protein|nr:type II secretion system protein M [Syntrophobacterales bacterium]